MAYWLYLVGSEYHNLYYDSGDYWQLSHRFYPHGRFELLAYDDALRGYAYPLLNFVCLAIRLALHVPAVAVVKVVNAALAGITFGVVGPRLWPVTTGATLPSMGRRCLWAGLVFIFWRDYFNFSLSDFPALLALGVALWQAQRRGPRAAVSAGMALALALNVRPIYLISVPAVLCLLLLGTERLAWFKRVFLFAMGAAFVLTPQWLINRRHFNASTPFVLSQSKELRIHSLYQQKLTYGLLHHKYESSVGPELPTGQLLFLNKQGAELLRAEQTSEFTSLPQYLGVVARHPIAVGSSLFVHLFAGLDISHPTPYLHRWEPSVWRQGLNYSLWFWALLVAWPRRVSTRALVVVAGLLLPCAAVLPMSMEARFLMPLHWLLLALVAYSRFPHWAIRGWRSAATLVCYAGFVAGCFFVSAKINQTVEPRFQPYLLPGGKAKSAATTLRNH